MSAIADAIKKAARSGLETYLKICEVDVFNEEERTIECTPLDGTATLMGVNLQAVAGRSDGALVVPKVGSFVVVGFLDKNNAVVLLYSEIEKSTFSATDTIVFNEGENGGLVVAGKIKDEFDEIATRCNDIVSALASLASAMSAMAQAPVLGAALGSAITSAIAPVMNPLATPPVTDYENEKIKH